MAPPNNSASMSAQEIPLSNTSLMALASGVGTQADVERHHRARGRDAFGDAVTRLRSFLHTPAPCPDSRRTCNCGSAGTHTWRQITHTGEPGEGLGRRQPRRRRQFRRHASQSSQRYSPVSGPTRHADGERNTFSMIRTFQADDISGDEGLEILGFAGFRDGSRIGDVSAADNRGRRLTVGDLLAQVRPGNRDEALPGRSGIHAPLRPCVCLWCVQCLSSRRRRGLWTGSDL